MKTANTTNWTLLLNSESAVEALTNFANGTWSKNKVAGVLAFSELAGEFRRLVRNNGTKYARTLTLKALKYRKLVS